MTRKLTVALLGIASIAPILGCRALNAPPGCKRIPNAEPSASTDANAPTSSAFHREGLATAAEYRS